MKAAAALGKIKFHGVFDIARQFMNLLDLNTNMYLELKSIVFQIFKSEKQD